MNTWSQSWEITIFFRKITFNSQIYYDITVFREFAMEFTIFFALFLWIHYFYANLLLIHYLICEFTMNSLYFSRVYFEFIILFANILWIHYIFREYTSNSLFFFRKITLNSQIYYEITIFRGFTMELLILHYFKFTFSNFSAMVQVLKIGPIRPPTAPCHSFLKFGP